MTAQTTDTAAHDPHVPGSDVVVKPPQRRGNPWLPSFHGVGLVTRIELRRRRPSTKGYVFYGILFGLVALICVLAVLFTPPELSSTNFEVVLLMVFGVGMLIAPSLSATSINGDSGEGVLAPLQMSHLTAGDIAFGKLIASWVVTLIALVAVSPFLIYTFVSSGWMITELLITLGAILLVVLAFTAVGLAWSSIAARAVASVALAHLTTGLFVIGTLIAFGVSTTLVTEESPLREKFIDTENLSTEAQEALWTAWETGDYSALNPDDYQCVDSEWAYTVTRTDQVAWIMLTNPVVMLIETAPIVDPETYRQDGRAAPGLFANLHRWISEARLGPMETLDDYVPYDECAELFGTGEQEELTAEEYEAMDAEWSERYEARQKAEANLERAPWLGLGVTVALLIGSMVVVIRRLRVPYKKLRTGTRVA
ncbi:ABC transporter permease [Demequina sp.]|uniref:ABC transporter permease n=1 Tax=Demequina sp. TaxID=2050685 RepID=UPI003A8C81E1